MSTIISSSSATLSSAVSQQLDKVLADTNTTTLVKNTVGNGSDIYIASAGNADINIVITPPTVATVGSFSEDAGSTMEFTIPANTGIIQKSTEAETVEAAQAYVENFIDDYISDEQALDPAVAQQKAALIEAIAEVLAQLQGTGTANINVKIRNIDFFSSSGSAGGIEGDELSMAILDSDGTYSGIDSLVGANEILLDASGSTDNQLFVLNLAGLGTKTLALASVDAAVLAASGTVRVEGNTPIRITSDNQAQNVSGGGGNDTLIGTGHDTLAGGAGNDVFGFSGTGKYVITDFSTAGDVLAFGVPGVTNLNQLKANVTSVVKTSTSITYNLGADSSITLVGISASDLTASMIKFTLG